MPPLATAKITGCKYRYAWSWGQQAQQINVAASGY